ncbi:MAG: hypothetical protein EAY65_03175 [Alphaproteobacteria bacterium]|nr:MAG: hypothetical protein EAY65_03175 [Alphaproteobacteria bacterium]
MSIFGAKTTLRGVSHYGAMGAALNNKRTAFEEERLREIGATLKKSRESFRLTVEHVAGELYVHPDRIRALELGDWSFANSDVYARGYLRNYADYLGLDYKVMTTKLQTPMASPQQPTATPVLRKSTLEKSQMSHWIMLAMAALFAIIAIVILLMQGQQPSMRQAKVEPIPDNLKHYILDQDMTRAFWWNCLHGTLLPDMVTTWECYAPLRYHSEFQMRTSSLYRPLHGQSSPYMMLVRGVDS